MAITNASRLADFGSGIGTEGAVLQFNNATQRVGIGTTNPQTTLDVNGTVTAKALSIGGVTVSSAGVGIATAGGTVGSGATLLDFRGAGISTVTVASGIATINITGGGGGSQLSISTTAPVSPTDGQLWFDNSDGNTYIWYASQNVWVVSQTYGY